MITDQRIISIVTELKTNAEAGKDIVGEHISNFICFSCDRTLPQTKVQESGLHQKHCLWNYFVYCTHCNYETSLAKCVGVRYECTCRR